MKLVRLVIGLATVLSTPSDIPSQSPNTDDIKSLQGTWVLQTVEWLGEETEQDATMDHAQIRREYLNRLPEERGLDIDTRKYQTRLTVTRNSLVFRHAGRVTSKGTFKLHVNMKPKVMERRTIKYSYHIHEASWSVFSSEDTYYCIYCVNGDTMRWCQRVYKDGRLLSGSLNEVPSKFATAKDDDILLLTFKRERQ